jgi:hypothetical protein
MTCPTYLGEALKQVTIVRFLNTFSEKCVPGKIDGEFQEYVIFSKKPGM